jgi:hypothetical protein
MRTHTHAHTHPLHLTLFPPKQDPDFKPVAAKVLQEFNAWVQSGAGGRPEYRWVDLDICIDTFWIQGLGSREFNAWVQSGAGGRPEYRWVGFRMGYF